MISAIVIKEWGAAPGLMKSQVNKITQASLVAAAENHYRTYMDLHFRPIAFSRYNYKPRAENYTQRKNYTFGHMLPLVWSGDSKRLALGGAPRIESTRYRATLVQRARGLNRRSRYSEIHMNEEIRAITQTEIATAARVAGRKFRQLVGEAHATKTTRV